MCLIIDKPGNVKLPMSFFEKAYDANPDGWGIMWFDTAKGKPMFMKNTSKFNKFKKAYEHAEATGARLLIHFRIRTEGSISQDNCHPFALSDGTLLMHNGVINISPITKHWSDTRQFADVLSNRVLNRRPGILAVKEVLKTVEASIGYNRLAFMLPDGTVAQTGTWTERSYGEYSGCKFSNQSYYRHLEPPTETTGYYRAYGFLDESYGGGNTHGGYPYKSTRYRGTKGEQFGWWQSGEFTPDAPTAASKSATAFNSGSNGAVTVGNQIIAAEQSANGLLPTDLDEMELDWDNLIDLDLRQLEHICRNRPREVADLLWDTSREWEDLGNSSVSEDATCAVETGSDSAVSHPLQASSGANDEMEEPDDAAMAQNFAGMG